MHLFHAYFRERNGSREVYIMVYSRERSRSRTQTMVLMAMFTAIIFIMAFTPVGLINLPVIKATILHIPVIIGAIVLGPAAGAYFGGLFGLTSLIKNTITPSALSFAFTPAVDVPGTGHGSFWAIIICCAPRILVGITPWLFYKAIEKAAPRMNEGARAGVLAASGAIGSFTNTFLVMGLIYGLFATAYATMKDIPVTQVGGVILGIIAANGIPEAIAAAVITPIVCLVLFRIRK